MITQLIFEWAKRTPDKAAVIYNGQTLSYQSFAQSIAKARRHFSRRGCIGPGYAVLAVHNLLDFWTISLAIRSFGLTTLAVPSVSELEKLSLANIRYVIVSSLEPWPGLKELCANKGLPLITVSLKGESPLWLEAGYAPSLSGGHILRISGTTGNFKMVLMSPAIDEVFLRRKVEVIGMNQNTVLCVFHFPPWSGAGYRWAASPWVVGGTTLIEQGREPFKVLLRPGISHAVLVPDLLAAILAAPEGAFPLNESMQLTVGGGAMTKNQVAQIKARITPHLHNWLASTEAGGITFTSVDTPDDLRWHEVVPDRKIEIVDEFDRPVPIGEIGRLRIITSEGPNGYLNDEASTQKFFKDGFFYPGDLAVMRSDGRIALQGRLTDVINMAGHKINPEPIENRLCEVFCVTGICLFSMQDDSGEEELHVVVEAPAPIETDRLMAALSQEIRGFPRAHIYYVPALARNQMGKVLRQAVRARAIANLGPSI